MILETGIGTTTHWELVLSFYKKLRLICMASSSSNLSAFFSVVESCHRSPLFSLRSSLTLPSNQDVWWRQISSWKEIQPCFDSTSIDLPKYWLLNLPLRVEVFLSLNSYSDYFYPSCSKNCYKLCRWIQVTVCTTFRVMRTSSAEILCTTAWPFSPSQKLAAFLCFFNSFHLSFITRAYCSFNTNSFSPLLRTELPTHVFNLL